MLASLNLHKKCSIATSLLLLEFGLFSHASESQLLFLAFLRLPSNVFHCAVVSQAVLTYQTTFVDPATPIGLHPPESIDAPLNGTAAAMAVGGATTNFVWTPGWVVLSIFLYIVTSLVELTSGWLIWHGVKSGKPKYWLLIGHIVMIAYAYLPTLQPSGSDEFGRVWAVYSGLFIIVSYAWAYYIDGSVPDRGDYVGSIVALIGVMLTWFWPRAKAV